MGYLVMWIVVTNQISKMAHWPALRQTDGINYAGLVLVRNIPVALLDFDTRPKSVSVKTQDNVIQLLVKPSLIDFRGKFYQLV